MIGYDWVILNETNDWAQVTQASTWIILGMGLANGRRRYIVRPSFIGWAYTQMIPELSWLAQNFVATSSVLGSGSIHILYTPAKTDEKLLWLFANFASIGSLQILILDLDTTIVASTPSWKIWEIMIEIQINLFIWITKHGLIYLILHANVLINFLTGFPFLL